MNITNYCFVIDPVKNTVEKRVNVKMLEKALFEWFDIESKYFNGLAFFYEGLFYVSTEYFYSVETIDEKINEIEIELLKEIKRVSLIQRDYPFYREVKDSTINSGFSVFTCWYATFDDININIKNKGYTRFVISPTIEYTFEGYKELVTVIALPENAFQWLYIFNKSEFDEYFKIKDWHDMKCVSKKILSKLSKLGCVPDDYFISKKAKLKYIKIQLDEPFIERDINKRRHATYIYIGDK